MFLAIFVVECLDKLALVSLGFGYVEGVTEKRIINKPDASRNTGKGLSIKT